MLRARGIHKKFEGKRNFWALKGVNLQLEAGKQVFVIGETGSGKSTLLRCIAGLETPEKGWVSWQGQKLQHKGQLIPGFQGMKLVAQDFDLKMYNRVNQVIEAVLPVGMSSTKRKEEVSTLLELFNLRAFANKQVIDLSGGQQQRLAIAQAFASLPQILLLDEPFAHLDPQLKNMLFIYLKKRVKEHGLSTITVTHDYNETLKHADWVVVLCKGQVVQQGSARELYEKPTDLYVAGLLGEYNCINQSGAQYIVRPEEVQLAPNGTKNARVLQRRFAGHFMEVEVEWEKQQVLMYVDTSQPLQEGDALSISFEPRLQWVEDENRMKILS